MEFEQVSPEELEQIRRRELQRLQEEFHKHKTDAEQYAWRMVFSSYGNWDENHPETHVWVPKVPLESITGLALRVTRNVALDACREVCQHCKLSGLQEYKEISEINLAAPHVWGGFGPEGQHVWLHSVTQPRESILDRYAKKLGLGNTSTVTVMLPCAASAIIKRFGLIDVPPTLPGVNKGAYAGDRPAYGDPEL